MQTTMSTTVHPSPLSREAPMPSIAQRARSLYEWLIRWSGPAVLSLVLLFMRIVWGWGFFQAGKGKFGKIEGVTEFFAKLNIPMPGFNAWLVAIVETVGGLLLMLGLGTRAVAV